MLSLPLVLSRTSTKLTSVRGAADWDRKSCGSHTKNNFLQCISVRPSRESFKHQSLFSLSRRSHSNSWTQHDKQSWNLMKTYHESQWVRFNSWILAQRVMNFKIWSRDDLTHHPSISLETIISWIAVRNSHSMFAIACGGLGDPMGIEIGRIVVGYHHGSAISQILAATLLASWASTYHFFCWSLGFCRMFLSEMWLKQLPLFMQWLAKRECIEDLDWEREECRMLLSKGRLITPIIAALLWIIS